MHSLSTDVRSDHLDGTKRTICVYVSAEVVTSDSNNRGAHAGTFCRLDGVQHDCG